jgi:hypothetical protein
MTAPDDDSPQQLALLGSEAALDGEVIPPEAAPHPERFAPSEAEMEALAGEVKAACALLEASVRTTFDRAVELGAVLLKARERLGHGWWLPWLRNRTKLKPGMTSMYMLLARGKEELPARDFQRVKKLGVAAGAAELRRRHREERETAKLPTPTEQDSDAQEEDDRDDGPDRFLTLEECARIACQEPDLWRLIGTDKKIELSEALRQADPDLHKRTEFRGNSLVDAAIEYAKHEVYSVPREIERSSEGESFTQEEEARRQHLESTVKIKVLASDLVRVMGILRLAVGVAVHDNEHGEADHARLVDTCIEIVGRFHRALYHSKFVLQRDRTPAEASDGEAA